MIRRIAITGAGGFLGRHLTALLRGQGNQVAGISRQSMRGDLPCDDWLVCDVAREQTPLVEFLNRFRPDAVVHLAATSFEPLAAAHPWEVLQNNLQSALGILTACRALPGKPTCVMVSSSAVYGHQDQDDLAVDETHPLRPLTNYGVSKLAVEALALQHHRAYGMRAIIVRPFNVTGPGEHASFVTSAFARQIALIEAGRQQPIIKAGDLTTTRDFTDVRDIATALAAVAESGEPGETYNVCSDMPVRVEMLVAKLLRVTTSAVEVTPDPSLMRPVEIRNQRGNSMKLRKATGWSPGYTLDKTLLDVLNDWRGRIRIPEA